MVKVFKMGDIKPSETPYLTVTRLVDEKTGAKKIGVLFNTAKPGKGMPYHYHNERETVYIVQQGRAKAIIEGKEFILEPNTVVLISAGEKHGLTNIGKTDYKYIEIISNPAGEDFVAVPEKK